MNTQEFRAFLHKQFPEGSAHLTDNDVAQLASLVGLIGNPEAAAYLIAQIDAVLDDPKIDVEVINRNLGVRFDTLEQAKSFLRGFRALFTGPVPKRR